SQKEPRLHTVAPMLPGQFRHGRLPVANDHREYFLRDREGVPLRFSRKSVIENAYFMGSGVIGLGNDLNGIPTQIVDRLMKIVYQEYALASFAHVWLQDDGKTP